MLLSYVPFKTEEDLGATQSVMSEALGSVKEGLYDSTKLSFFQRKSDQDEIIRFTDHIFGTRQQINYNEFSHINQNITSEMFTSIMRVLHETLPCSRNFFGMKRKYRLRQLAIDEEFNTHESKIREIASPRIVRGLSLGKSPTRRQSSRGMSVESGGASF